MRTDKDDLDALFAEARGGETPSADLTARVLADAARVQADMRGTLSGPRRGGWLLQGIAALGGWRGLSGLAVAGVSGLMIGVYATDAIDLALNGQLTALTGGDASALIPGIESLVLSVNGG